MEKILEKISDFIFRIVCNIRELFVKDEDRRIYNIIKKAKELYIRYYYNGEYSFSSGEINCMCTAFACAVGLVFPKQLPNESFPYIINLVYKNIPEFNSLNLAGEDRGKFDFWWKVSDKKSRIEAFDYLLKVYKHSERKFVIYD